jgi:drug/metabolite transporter (DMT)-like permease
MGAVGYVGQAFSYFTAVKYASPGLVGLLLYLYPTFVAILSAVWLHEPMTRLKASALGLALAGTALTVGPAGGQFLGVVSALSAAAAAVGASVAATVGGRAVGGTGVAAGAQAAMTLAALTDMPRRAA